MRQRRFWLRKTMGLGIIAGQIKRVTLKCSEGRRILMRKDKQLAFVMGVICQFRIAVNDYIYGGVIPTGGEWDLFNLS